jgi:hypothetical protein
MTQRKRPGPSDPRPRPPRERPPALTVLRPAAAGIDVHADMHMVCVPADRAPPGPAPEPGGLPAHVRRFGANSCDLAAVADWLAACGVTTVAMESTGVYWVPLFELLEARGFEVWLVEPGQLSRCGARPKTDVLDCQWIQRLHSYGLLERSFRPPDSVLALRAYHRQRQMQVRYAASHFQHMQKALEQMNVKLTEVVSSVTGLACPLLPGQELVRLQGPRRLFPRSDLLRHVSQGRCQGRMGGMFWRQVEQLRFARRSGLLAGLGAELTCPREGIVVGRGRKIDHGFGLRPVIWMVVRLPQV